MGKRSLSLLVIWNVLLSAALIWCFVHGTAKHADASRISGAAALPADSTVKAVIVPRDSSGLKNGRIAFFFMDSVQSQYSLVKESADRVRSEGKRMEGDLQREMTKAQNRYTELTSKDHTYSTQTELKADQAELEQLSARIQEMRSNSQDRLDEMQSKMLQDITLEIQNFLEEYNKVNGFDYIFSIQSGGQIWVGNKGLDISNDVIAGLNERHKAKKAAPAK